MSDHHGDYGLSPYAFSNFRVSGNTRFTTFATNHGMAIMLDDFYDGTKAMIADGLASDVAEEIVRVLNEAAKEADD